MRSILRTFIALWYLLGWISHVFFGLVTPDVYAAFGGTAVIPGFEAYWQKIIMPNIVFFALVLAVFEITVGFLLINKGQWVKYGLTLSIFFNVFLVQLGLGMPVSGAGQDFLINRLPNLVFIALQIPLFPGSYQSTIPGMIRERCQR